MSTCAAQSPSTRPTTVWCASRSRRVASCGGSALKALSLTTGGLRCTHVLHLLVTCMCSRCCSSGGERVFLQYWICVCARWRMLRVHVFCLAGARLCCAPDAEPMCVRAERTLPCCARWRAPSSTSLSIPQVSARLCSVYRTRSSDVRKASYMIFLKRGMPACERAHTDTPTRAVSAELRRERGDSRVPQGGVSWAVRCPVIRYWGP